MESKTAKLMAKIAFYKNHGTHTITIPKKVIEELGLQKGDSVVVSITPAFRPYTEGEE